MTGVVDGEAKRVAKSNVRLWPTVAGRVAVAKRPKRLFIHVRIEPPEIPNLQLQNECETVPGIPDKVACRDSGRRSGD